MREETKYIVVHCSQTRPSQDIGAKDIDRWHRERGWLKIGYGKVIKRDGTIEQGRGDDDVQAHVKGYNHCSYGLCLVGGALEEDWKKPEDNFTAEQWEALVKHSDKQLKPFEDHSLYCVLLRKGSDITSLLAANWRSLNSYRYKCEPWTDDYINTLKPLYIMLREKNIF